MSGNKIAVTLSLDKEDLEFIDRAGVGNNQSEKARDILARAGNVIDTLVTWDGTRAYPHRKDAICVFENTVDGEKKWSPMPFEFPEKTPWRKIHEYAADAGYLCQVIEDKATGYAAVWIAKPIAVRDCDECRARILAAIENK